MAAVTAVAAAEAGRKISALMAVLLVANARRERLKFFLRTKRKLRLRWEFGAYSLAKRRLRSISRK